MIKPSGVYYDFFAITEEIAKEDRDFADEIHDSFMTDRECGNDCATFFYLPKPEDTRRQPWKHKFADWLVRNIDVKYGESILLYVSW